MKLRNSPQKVGGALLALPIYILVQTCFIPCALSHTTYIPAQEPPISPYLTTIFETRELSYNLNGKNWKVKDLGDVYLITNFDSPEQMKIVERLANGGFGRILLYKGITQEGKWVHLEFIYEDHENVVTILDYLAKKFYRTKFTEKASFSFALFPSDFNKGLTQELLADSPKGGKYLVFIREVFGVPILVGSQLDRAHQFLSKIDFWLHRLVRGPPVEEALL